MNSDKKFFRDFYDGQVIKTDSEKYKLFKIMLFSIVSVFALFMYLAELCNLAELVMIELAMIWNFYTKLNNKFGVILCVFVSVIYFVIACNFHIYSNALIYIAFYIPFQLFASTKEYNSGDFVQIKKKMSDYIQATFVITAVCLSVVFYMFDIAVGARFETLDALSAGCLVASALLRNERYNDYYSFRFLALILSVALWVCVAVEYGDTGVFIIIAMYLSYIVFDSVTYFVQKKTYVNEYMLAVEKHTKIENEKIINEKIKVYEKKKELNK